MTAPPICGSHTAGKPGTRTARVTQRYHIRSDHALWPDGDACGDLQAFYRAESRSDQAEWGYHSVAVVCSRGDAYLDITSKTNTRIDLHVVGTCGNSQWTAHTAHPLFGKVSPDTREPSARTVDLPQGVVRLRLGPSRHTDYMQTGTPYHFDYSDNDGTIEIVLVKETATDRTYADTFTLLLHRSVYGYHRLPPGTILFSAAGTGRFFEVAARILDTPVQAFGELGREAADPVNINSTCAVFAESEMVSLMAKGIAKECIIQGLHEAVARRVASLASNSDLTDDVCLDGGSANNSGLVMAIEDELYRDVHVLTHPQFTVAYGAARSLETICCFSRDNACHENASR